MLYARIILLVIFALQLEGCRKRTWEEKHIDVLAPAISEVMDNPKKYPEYSVNNVAFGLKIGCRFMEEKKPFSILLEASSKDAEKHVIKVEQVSISSNKGHQYDLLGNTKLPRKLNRKRSDMSPFPNYYFIEFGGRLAPSFNEDEKIALNLTLSVDGKTKEISYNLIPVIKEFSTEGLLKPSKEKQKSVGKKEGLTP